MKVVFLFVFFSCTSFKSWWVVSWHFFSYLWASYTSCGTLLKTPRTICILPHLKLLNISNNKKPLTAAFSLACLKIRSRNEEAINSTRNKMDLLAKCFLLPTLLTSILFTCFWIDLVRVLATTGNTSAVAGYTRAKYTKIHGLRFQRNYIIGRDHKSVKHGTSFQSSPKRNGMLIATSICIQRRFTTPDHRSFAN